MADNGGGGSGGNTSVFWEIRHGSRGNPKPPNPHNGGGPPDRGEFKVQNVVMGHSDADFNEIGKPDHHKLFKVILRFRDGDWDDLVRKEEKAWILQRARRVGSDLFLEIHVPAIERDMPGADGKWEKMPWEIQWEW
jgi:hypothetical protein